MCMDQKQIKNGLETNKKLTIETINKVIKTTKIMFYHQKE